MFLGELGSPRISVDMENPTSVRGELGSPRTSIDMGIPMSIQYYQNYQY